MNRLIVPQPLLFVDHAPAVGGAEQSLLLLLQHLDRGRWQPHLASVPGLLLEQAAGLGVPVHPLPLPRLRRSPRFTRDWQEGAGRIATIARQVQARLLIANTVRAALYTAPAARLARRPVIWMMRDFWLGESRPARLWPDRLGKWLLARAARLVIANSQATAAHLPAAAHTLVIHNGLDVGRFDPALDGVPFRQAHGIPAGAPIVGMAGRLRPWKGPETFLQMAAQFHEADPPPYFLLIGGQPFGDEDGYEQHLHQLAAQSPIAERLRFTGHLADIRPALAALDIFVHPGQPEPFGLVNIEAMAMARPVVAFAHGALPEIVLHGQTGLLVPPGDVVALANAVRTLLADPEQRRAMGCAGRERVETHFTIQRVAREVDAALQKVLDP